MRARINNPVALAFLRLRLCAAGATAMLLLELVAHCALTYPGAYVFRCRSGNTQWVVGTLWSARMICFWLLLSFHVTNFLLFEIGVFPPLSIMLTGTH